MLDKYFSVTGFKMLNDILSSHTQGMYVNKNWVRNSPYTVDAEELENMISYDYDDLDAGDYETTHFKIRAVKSYITNVTSVTVYEVTLKD